MWTVYHKQHFNLMDPFVHKFLGCLMIELISRHGPKYIRKEHQNFWEKNYITYQRICMIPSESKFRIYKWVMFRVMSYLWILPDSLTLT